MFLLRKHLLVALVALGSFLAQSAFVSATQGASSAEQPEYRLEPVAMPNAVYPPQAREQKAEGEIVASLLVSDTGDVKNVRVFKGDPLLVKSVEDAVGRSKFKAVMKGEKPIIVIATAKFKFVLSDDNQAANGVVPELGPGRETPQRVRVSSGVAAGLLVRKVQPSYPSDAREAHIQGVVLLRATVSKEGEIADVQVISGPRELAPAAIEAVRQWRYKPYLLMGEPVEVDTQIQVNFQLRY
jgi:TonB family protein